MIASQRSPRTLPLSPRVSLGFACVLGLAFWYLRHKLDLRLRQRSLSESYRLRGRFPKADKEEPIKPTLPSDPPVVTPDPGGPLG